ncbi:hypothetical protein [Pseudoalteromonas sp.]|uniref:hypothetical protein n=1 Tax=Pseudoalteromonas sp. TaxID=53249 RepID=UPI003D099CFE
MSKYKNLEKANERINELEKALSELIFDSEQIYNVGFFSESLNWVPKESVVDALEVRVDISKLILESDKLVVPHSK